MIVKVPNVVNFEMAVAKQQAKPVATSLIEDT